MPRINLLPWREERLKEQQKAFGVATLVVAAVGGLIVYGAMRESSTLISACR